ncbi:MAG: acetyl-CoA C-acetyltransferase [Candidatus Riflebacteria bacterium]|nr:acetyl-CoA C-acetyltransferase [Candidatus Riflebacteria bacterium]
MDRDAFIFEAVRTPRGKGKPDGSLHEVKPVDLLAGLLRELGTRTGLDTGQVDDVVIGCVTPVGEQGMDIAKTALLVADWAETVPGFQLNRFCASGLAAVDVAAAKVRSGFESLVVAGGVESMSRVPMASDGGAWAFDPETSFKTGFIPQGVCADLVATLERFSREDVDAVARRSHERAAHARRSGFFQRSIVPVKDRNGLPILEHDELIREGCTMETLARLKPSFEQLAAMGFASVAQTKYPHVDRLVHVHTPGNSSGIVDGACVLLIGSAAKGKDLGLKPRARIVSYAVTSTDPTIMLLGPGPAARKALAIAGLDRDGIDLFEVNEAFAAVALRFEREMGVSSEKVNVNGGAIALGHPLGATGAMLVNTLLDELERRGLRHGLATLCVGAGMGEAIIIERV